MTLLHTGRWRAALAALAMVVGPVWAAPAMAQEPVETGAESAARVDSLVALGRLQEASWVARASGDTARAGSLLVRLRAILTSPPLQARPLSMDSQGVSYTFRLDHGHGVRSIFKVEGSDIFCRQCGSDREVATYAVDRLLGLDLVPMTVSTRVVDEAGDTLTGSTMYFVHGASTPSEAGAEKPDRLHFLDAVIGNTDRHRSNWLVLPDGRAVAIDHNRAFQYRPVSRPKTCWETEVDALERPGSLGRPYERYRTLPADSLAAAVAVLDPALATAFVAMRARVVDRVEARAEAPEREQPLVDCVFDG